MSIKLSDKVYRNTQEQVLKNAEDIEKLKAGTILIPDGAVTAPKIAGEAVTTEKLAPNAISTSKIQAGAVTTTKLDSQAVTTAKLADGAVTTDKIADSAVTNEKIDTLNITKLVDSSGNYRFIEGDIATETISGVTINYDKWSLSGTHLMIVLAGQIETSTTLSANTNLGNIILPQFILDKIYPTFGTEYLELKNVLFADGNATTQSGRFMLRKAYGRIYIYNVDALTITGADKGFRAQFDLLIDTE